MTTIDFSRFEAITFDCYGTLIDWERGILNALQPVLAPRGIDLTEDELLERYARHEAALEAGAYRPYRQVLGESLSGLGKELGFDVADEEVARVRRGSRGLAGVSRHRARATPSADAVQARRDHELRPRPVRALEPTARRHGSTGSSPPRTRVPTSRHPAPFELAFATIDVPRDRILHAAQSLFHDHVPGKQLGLTTAWVDRRHDRPGFGATPAASATPDLTVPDMAAFADVALG